MGTLSVSIFDLGPHRPPNPLLLNQVQTTTTVYHQPATAQQPISFILRFPKAKAPVKHQLNPIRPILEIGNQAEGQVSLVLSKVKGYW